MIKTLLKNGTTHDGKGNNMHSKYISYNVTPNESLCCFFAISYKTFFLIFGAII